MERAGRIGGRRTRRIINWSHEQGREYEALQYFRICPTRGIDIPTLANLGIKDDVLEFFETLGMSGIINLTGPVYPDLVKEFLASCDLTFEGDSVNAEDGVLSFFLKKRFYKLSLLEFCDVYNFPHYSDTFIEDLPQEAEFWNTIAASNDDGEYAKLQHIRNPALRIVAKTIEQALFFQQRSDLISGATLALLFHGTKHLLPHLDTSREYKVNLGGVLARLLVDYRSSPKSDYRKVHRGTILTPLFEALYIDRSQETKSEEIEVADVRHMLKSDILKSYFEYSFHDRDKKTWLIELPQRERTSLCP